MKAHKLAVATALSAIACGAPPLISDSSGVKGALGRAVRVAGMAENAKLSAVVQARDLTVYCLNWPGWPADQAKQPVVVEGILESTRQFAARTVDGEVSQGTEGPVLVIRRCAIRR
jgi:hypothetical protein